MNILEMNHIKKKFDEKTVLKDISLSVKEGEVVLLQNTRFRGAEETKNGEEFSKELADLADIYVCDAFGSSHRAHASVAGVTKFITAKGGQNVVGYLMEKEIAFLGNAVENPVRPFVAILGGAKVADKLNVINNLLEKCDTLIIGGGMAYTFLKAKGYEIGLSLVDDSKLDYCKEMMEKAEKLGKKLLLPTGKAYSYPRVGSQSRKNHEVNLFVALFIYWICICQSVTSPKKCIISRSIRDYCF